MQTPAGEGPLLDVRDLTIEYFSGQSTSARAVDGVTFRIDAGESIGVLGESGSGKSSVALALLGLLPSNGRVARGSIVLRGRELANGSERDWRNVRGKEIALISQEPVAALNPVLRIDTQIAEVLRVHQPGLVAGQRKQIEVLLAEVGISDVRRISRSYPHQLSGGQAQRVVIAQALACRPALLVADEPTASLDPTVQREILHLLRRLCKRRGMAMFIISHQPAVLGSVSDRIFVMTAGQIVETGAAAAVLGDPKHPYTLALIAAMPGRSQPDEPAPLQSISQPRTAGIFISESVSRPPLILARGLSRTFPGKRWPRSSAVRALDDVSFTLEAGTTLALIGESGSGKTTLGLCLAGLIDPDGGEIRFGSVDVLGLRGQSRRDYRRQVQVVFQDTALALNPSLTVAESLEEPLWVEGVHERDEIRRRAVEALCAVGLQEDYMPRRPSMLSGGQRQRLALARAMVLRPAVTILDEVLRGLDLIIQAQILDLLRQLRQELGLTYVFITHDLDMLPGFADRVAVMHDGRIVEQGSATEVLSHPRHPHTKQLLDARLQSSPLRGDP